MLQFASQSYSIFHKKKEYSLDFFCYFIFFKENKVALWNQINHVVTKPQHKIQMPRTQRVLTELTITILQRKFVKIYPILGIHIRP